MSSTGQFGQTYSIGSADVTYTKPASMGCYVCSHYATNLAAVGVELIWLCSQHYAEYLRGDTDWWELTRLITNG